MSTTMERGVAFSILLLLLGANAMAQSSIAGTVRGPSGQGLQGMAVAAFNVEGTTSFGSTTDGQGRYLIALSAGEYRLLAYDPAGVHATMFFPNAESFETSSIIQLGASQRLTGYDFQLERAGKVTGRVTDTNSVPLAGMTVAAYNLSGTRREFTTTNASGAYTIVLPPGSFRVAAYDERLDFVTEFFFDTFDFNQAVTLGVDADETITAVDFQLQRGGKVTGRVTDLSTGQPLKGKIVALYDSSGRPVIARETSSTGQYGLAVAPGTYRLLAFDNDGIYATSYHSNAESFETSMELRFEVGQALTADFALVRGGRINGRVSARGTGGALRDMVVAAYNLSGYRRGFVRTDAAGDYSILLPPGQYKLAAYDERLGYGTVFYRDAMTFSSALVVAVTAASTTPAIDFTMDPTTTRRRRAARR